MLWAVHVERISYNLHHNIVSFSLSSVLLVIKITCDATVRKHWGCTPRFMRLYIPIKSKLSHLIETRTVEHCSSLMLYISKSTLYLKRHSVAVMEENIHRQQLLFFWQWNRQVHERIIFNGNLKQKLKQ